MSGTKRKVDGTPTGVAKPIAVSGFEMTRVRQLNTVKERVGDVLYWMSRDQRIRDNHALEYARAKAMAMGTRLIVCFSLTPSFLGAVYRHYHFMLHGLAEVEKDAASFNIPFVVLLGEANETVPTFALSQNIALVVTDFSPLRIGVSWRQNIASTLNTTPEFAGIAVHEVDAHNIVPVWVASDKQEYAARTIRPKIMGKLQHYLKEFATIIKQDDTMKDWAPTGLIPVSAKVSNPTPPNQVFYSLSDAGGRIETPHHGTVHLLHRNIQWEHLLENLPVDKSVPPVTFATPGFSAGTEHLHMFLTGISHYAAKRNDPTVQAQSNLSPWLHYGQIAPARCALEAYKLRKSAPAAVDAFIEELVVRRELTDNFCFYNSRYDELSGLYPSFDNRHWAQLTLETHATDARASVYTLEEFERGETHEALWNAAQLQMVYVGKMHGFMRMYWAKKILEWSSSPEEALRIAVYLNDKYQIDGRDPNGYVGCAWAIAGLHDNAWTERPVFGKIRYMNLAGCKTKFNVARYIENIAAIVPKECRKFLKM